MAGQYVETFPIINGCDSTVTLNLTLKQVFNESETMTICQGESFNFGGTNLTTAGQYQHTFTSNTVGCDSTVTLTLQVTVINASILVNGEDLQAMPDGGAYQWLDCDAANAPISGQAFQVFSPEESGSFSVQVTKNNCTETSECQDVVITAVERATLSVGVSPNPANDKVVITFSEVQPFAQVSLLSATGQSQMSKEFYYVDRAELDTRGIPAGFYLLTVKTSTGNKVMRLVVK